MKSLIVLQVAEGRTIGESNITFTYIYDGATLFILFYTEQGAVVFQVTMFFWSRAHRWLYSTNCPIQLSPYVGTSIILVLLFISLTSVALLPIFFPHECSRFTLKNQYEKPSHVSLRLGSAPKRRSSEVIYASPGNWKENTLAPSVLHQHVSNM